MKINKIQSYNLKTSLIKFGWFYKIKRLRTKIFTAIIIGLFYSLATTLFVKNTSLYTGGTSAFFYGVARFVKTLLYVEHANLTNTQVDLIYNGLFWGLYLLMNIPLFIIAYKKVGKHFAIISFVFIVVERASGFGWGMLQDLSNGHFTLDIFGPTNNMNGYMDAHYGIETIVLNPNIFPSSNNDITAFIGGANDIPWTTGIIPGADSNVEAIEFVRNGNYIRTLSLILYAVCFSIISATCVCILFIIGGSSAGSDFITIMYSVKKHKDVGKIYTLINGIFMISGCIIGSYLSGIIAWNDLPSVFKTSITSNPFTNITYLISANLLASLIWIVLNGIFIEKLFPSKKTICVEVASVKNKEIDKMIFSQNEFHAFPIKRFHNKTSTIKFICSYLEFTHFLKEIKTIDENALITSNFAQDIDGPIDLYKNNFKD